MNKKNVNIRYDLPTEEDSLIDKDIEIEEVEGIAPISKKTSLSNKVKTGWVILLSLLAIKWVFGGSDIEELFAKRADIQSTLSNIPKTIVENCLQLEQVDKELSDKPSLKSNNIILQSDCRQLDINQKVKDLYLNIK